MAHLFINSEAHTAIAWFVLALAIYSLTLGWVLRGAWEKKRRGGATR